MGGDGGAFEGLREDLVGGELLGLGLVGEADAVAEGVVEEVLPCLAIARILSALTTKPDADSLSGSMLKAVFIERNESATLRAFLQTRYSPFS